ncbi:MAG: hemin uptake protein HemP [Pseudotabrizicola sp.]|nr:hemin uptake protein HemP [Pseudotabrizicola sp.]MDO9637797.1 hemin uptake protein HemP [Pseudotabrizicola sp.]
MNALTDMSQLAAAIPLHDATALTEGGREARILLNGMVYSLRITRQGKLILTK